MPLRRIIFDTTLLLEVANCCVEINILRMPCIPLHRLSVVSDCLLIVASRLGYRATVEVMLPDYWRREYAECDEDGCGKAEGRNEKSKQNNSGNQNNKPKSAEREQSNMRDDSRAMEQRQLQTGKVRADRILNPFKQNGTKNQKAAKDEQPISRPELSGCLCPWHQAFGYIHA